MLPDGVVVDNKKQQFFIKTNKGWYIVSGYAMVYKGIRMFLHRSFRSKDGKLSFSRNRWTISNYDTGLAMCGAYDDMNKAIEFVVRRIEMNGVDNVREMIQKRMNEGVPPYEGGI